MEILIKPTKHKEKTTYKTLYVSEELIQKITRIAEVTNTSYNNVIKSVLEHYYSNAKPRKNILNYNNVFQGKKEYKTFYVKESLTKIIEEDAKLMNTTYNNMVVSILSYCLTEGKIKTESLV